MTVAYTTSRDVTLDSVTGHELDHVLPFVDGSSGDEERQRDPGRCFGTMGEVDEQLGH